MAKQQEIWVYQGSPTVRLARSLADRYSLHVAERPSRRVGSHGAAQEPSGAAVWLVDPVADPVTLLRRLARKRPDLRLIAVTTARSVNRVIGREWFSCIPRNSPPALVDRAIAAAFTHLKMAARELAAREELERAEREREELNRIGMALSATHDVGVLLQTILAKTREITGADAGSLYVVETVQSGKWKRGKVPAPAAFQAHAKR